MPILTLPTLSSTGTNSETTANALAEAFGSQLVTLDIGLTRDVTETNYVKLLWKNNTDLWFGIGYSANSYTSGRWRTYVSLQVLSASVSFNGSADNGVSYLGSALNLTEASGTLRLIYNDDSILIDGVPYTSGGSSSLRPFYGYSKILAIADIATNNILEYNSGSAYYVGKYNISSKPPEYADKVLRVPAYLATSGASTSSTIQSPVNRYYKDCYGIYGVGDNNLIQIGTEKFVRIKTTESYINAALFMKY